MKITKQYLFSEIDTIIYFTPNGRYINFQGIIISEEQFNNNVTVFEYHDEIKKALKDTDKYIDRKDIIMDIIFDYFSYNEENIEIRSRKRDILFPQQCLMYFLNKYTNMTYSSIGAFVGGRDHATVIHACRNAIPSYLTFADNRYRNQIKEIEARILKQIKY